MDRKTNENNERKSEDSDAKDLQIALQIIDGATKRTNLMFDGLLKSRWIWGKFRGTLIMFKGLVDITAMNAKDNLTNSFVINNIQKRLDYIEKMIDEISFKTKTDLSQLKSEIKKVILPKPVQTYMEEFHKDWEEWKRIQKRYFRGQ